MLNETSISELQTPAAVPPGPSVERPDRLKGEVSLLDLLIVVAERKRLVLKITAIFAIIAILVSLVLPKRYTATATLLPPQQNSSMASTLAAQLGNLGGMTSLTGTSGLGVKNSNDTYVAMLKSRTVEDAMVKRFELMKQYNARYLSDARKTFESNVKVDGNGKDGLIHISVEDRNANRAAELANGYVDQFRYLSEHVAITEASRRRLFFEQQLEDAKTKLQIAEERLRETEEKTGILQLNGQAGALVQSAVLLRGQVAAKEVEIQSLRTFATDENAEVVKAKQELESLRAQLAKLGRSGDPNSSDLLPKGKVSQAGLEFLRKERDVKYYETVFEILARQFEAAKLDEAKQGAIIQVLDSAIVPDRKSFPKRALIVIFATLVGFFVGILYALWQAALDYLKQDPELGPRISILQAALSFRRLKNVRA